jgi:hypothetical protein
MLGDNSYLYQYSNIRIMGGCVGGTNKKPLEARNQQEEEPSPDRLPPRTDVAVNNDENNIEDVNGKSKAQQIEE